MTAVVTLEAGLDLLGLALPEETVPSLTRYLELITKWNKVHNLTAVRDPQRMVIEHILDSLSVLSAIRPKRILDVGSGAGLPGIPFAVARPGWQLTLLDSSQKRCAFLRQTTIELGLRNVEVVCQRAEVYEASMKFDTVVSRAFSDLADFVRLGVGPLRDDGVMMAMKGRYPRDELAQLPPNVRVLDVRRIDVPGLDAQRHAVLMTKA